MDNDNFSKGFLRCGLQTSRELIQVALIKRCEVIHYKKKVICNVKNKFEDKMLGSFSLHYAQIILDFNWRVRPCGVQKNEFCALIHINVLKTQSFGVDPFSAW